MAASVHDNQRSFFMFTQARFASCGSHGTDQGSTARSLESPTKAEHFDVCPMAPALFLGAERPNGPGGNGSGSQGQWISVQQRAASYVHSHHCWSHRPSAMVSLARLAAAHWSVWPPSIGLAGQPGCCALVFLASFQWFLWPPYNGFSMASSLQQCSCLIHEFSSSCLHFLYLSKFNFLCRQWLCHWLLCSGRSFCSGRSLCSGRSFHSGRTLHSCCSGGRL